MSDLLQLAYLVFNNWDMAKTTEGSQREKEKAQMTAMALSTQGPPKQRPDFPGQTGHGRHKATGTGHLDKVSVPCVDRRDTRTNSVIHVPLQTARALAESRPQMPASDGGLSEP